MGTRVMANFTHVGLESSVEVFEHDAATPFPDVLKADPPDIIAANPPWGWRLKATSGSQKPNKSSGDANSIAHSITMNLMHQFPNAVIALACPDLPRGQVLEDAGFT